MTSIFWIIFYHRAVHCRCLAGRKKWTLWNCHSGTYEEMVCQRQGPLTILEGSYSQRPAISSYSDLQLFVTCEKEEQHRRLTERKADRYIHFEQLWIPKEEAYFHFFRFRKAVTG